MLTTPRASRFEIGPDGNLPEQVFRDIHAQFSANGASLLKLAAGDVDLIFPDRVTTSGKRRGGSFFAIPQFGIDNRPVDVQQPQHGYGRVEVWSPTNVGPNRVVMTHVQETGEYAGLCSIVRYELTAGIALTRLAASLRLYNDTELDNNPMVVSPAAHPYISLDALADDVVADIQHATEVAHTVPARQVTVDVAPGRELVVDTVNLPWLTFWSESMSGKFLCVEPSVAGAAFSRDGFKPTDEQILEPGETREYSMSLTWRPIKSRTPR